MFQHRSGTPPRIERNPLESRIKRFTASLLGSRSRAYRTPLSRAFYCYVNVLDGIFLVAKTDRFEKGPRSNNGPNFKTSRRTVS